VTDIVKVVIEQAVGGGPVEQNGSRLTFEVFGLDNTYANIASRDMAKAIVAVVDNWAAQKAAANPTG